jgi:hypothetical protein
MTLLLLLSSFKDDLLGLHLIEVVVPAAVSIIDNREDCKDLRCDSFRQRSNISSHEPGHRQLCPSKEIAYSLQ